MACQGEIRGVLGNADNHNPSFLQHPTPSTPPPTNLPDACYSCKRKGHWSRDCPNKFLKNSYPSTPTSTSAFPILQCPCGRGTCPVKTFTKYNHGKMFYCCPSGPAPDGCNFKQWCQGFEKIEVPMCECGAGPCSLNARSIGGLGDYRWYFACRIRKTHGACGFSLCANDQVIPIVKEQDKLRGTLGHQSPSPPPKSPVVGRSSEISLYSAATVVHSEKEVVPNVDGKSCDPTKQTVALPHLRPQSFVHRRQMEFSRKISDAGDTLCEGKIGSTVENVCNSEGPTFLWSTLSNEGSHVPVPVPPAQFNGEDPQFCSALREPSGLNNPRCTASILEDFLQQLLHVRQPMNPSDHGRMLNVAKTTLDALPCLSIALAPSSDGLKEYSCCASRLIEIDGAMQGEISPEALINQYYSEKDQFDSASRCHKEVVAAHKVAEDHVRTLRGELSFYSSQELERKNHVVETLKDLLDSEIRMEAAYEKMEGALNLEQQRDLALDAANTALESTKDQLLQYLYNSDSSHVVSIT